MAGAASAAALHSVGQALRGSDAAAGAALSALGTGLNLAGGAPHRSPAVDALLDDLALAALHGVRLWNEVVYNVDRKSCATLHRPSIIFNAAKRHLWTSESMFIGEVDREGSDGVKAVLQVSAGCKETKCRGVPDETRVAPVRRNTVWIKGATRCAPS